MMKDKKRKMAAFLAAVSAAALCLCQAAFAAESAGIEEDRQSVLSIDLEGQDKMATMALYHVGEWDGSQGTYVLTGDFGGASVSFADMMSEEGMSVDDTRAACEALIGYAVANGIQPVDLRTTEGGRLQFAPVDTGIYLVAQVGDSSTFQVSSFLTTLPVLEDGAWDYAVVAHPKNADVPVPPPAPTEPATQPSGGGGGGGGGRRTTAVQGGTVIGEGDVPLQTINDENTPLGQILDTIEDALTPLAGLLPKTGDRSISYLPLFLAFMASGAGIILFAVKRKWYG